jgi:hypothetical protein
MERIQSFFQSSPAHFGFVPVALGLLLIVAAIRKWKWLTEGGDGKTFNDTWFISMFGIKKLRRLYIIFGVVLILIGVVWFFIFRELGM